MKMLPVILIIISVTGYHVCQKILGRSGNSLAVLPIAYFIAFLFSVGIFILSGEGFSRIQGSSLIFPIIGLGLTCLGVELGYFLAYRNGWNMNALFMQNTVACTTAVMLVAFFLFKEPFSIKFLLGGLLAMAGVFLMR